MPNSIFNYTTENRGRVLLLFLLFLLAIYELATAGFTNFAIISISPILLLFVIAVFRWRMMAFWLLIVANWFIQFKNMNWHMPLSLVDEMLELLLIGVAIIDVRKTPHFDRTLNMMFLSIMVWCGLCCLEILNDTCGLGINFNAWFTGARLMALQLVWIILVFTLYIDSPQILIA